MQKFTTGEGVVLIGRDAVMDTMGDIIVDALGAFTVTAIGYINLKKQQKIRIVEEEEQKMWIESEKTGS